MGPVEQAIRTHVPAGSALETPGRSRPFTIAEPTRDDLRILIANEHDTPVSWVCLEGIVPFLSGKGWVRLGGGVRKGPLHPGSFDEYVKNSGCHRARDVTNWIAVVLQRAGVVDIKREGVLQIRLAAGLAQKR
jgi:hypothetical protein